MKPKHKFYYSITLLIILFISALKFAFSETFDLKNELKSINHNKAQQEQQLNQTKLLLKQQKYYSNELNKYQYNPESNFQNNLLNYISSQKLNEKITIKQFSNPFKYNLEQGIQETYVFEVEGNFNSILQLIFNLEQHFRIAKIISFEFNSFLNSKSDKIYLKCQIYLQRFVLKSL